MTLPDFSVFGSFPPQTGYQGPGGTRPGSHLPGELSFSSRGLPVSVPEAFTQPRRQRDVSVSDTASTVPSLSADTDTDGAPSSPLNNAMNSASIINHNADLTQVSHFTSTTLGPAYNEFRYNEQPVITIFIKIIDSNVKIKIGQDEHLFTTTIRLLRTDFLVSKSLSAMF